jgi:hypothetical protein
MRSKGNWKKASKVRRKEEDTSQMAQIFQRNLFRNSSKFTQITGKYPEFSFSSLSTTVDNSWDSRID